MEFKVKWWSNFTPSSFQQLPHIKNWIVVKSLSNFQNPFQLPCLLFDNHLSQTTHSVISPNKLLKAHLKMLQQKDVETLSQLGSNSDDDSTSLTLQDPPNEDMCYGMLYTSLEQDWPSFQISSNAANWLKKRPYQQIVGPYLLSNWLLSSMLHFFLKSGFFAKIDNSSSSKTPKFKIFKYEWAMVNSSHDTSSTKTNFLSMDFKPLQIRELQASSNPLPKLYIRGSSLHRKQKPQLREKKYLREIPLVVRKTL